ncbi:MAG: hypothetical protein ABI251_10230 [Mycobacteriaceae bacterium]
MTGRPLIVILVVLAAGGCASAGPPPSPPMISRLDVERGASDQVGTQLQEAPPIIDCANDLPRQLGAGQDCSETDLARGQRHAVSVHIAGIQGATITYSVVVSAAPLPPPAD